MNIIFGAGGVARELTWILFDLASRNQSEMLPNGYVTADQDVHHEETVDGLPVWSESEFFLSHHATTRNAFLAIGNPPTRSKVWSRISNRIECKFPTIIHPQATLDFRRGKVKVGQGSIIYPNALLTTSIELGTFVQVNPSATIGHGVSVGDFVTICPGVHVSGNVVIGSRCFLGAGSILRENINIADDCVIGAGAVVVRDISESGTWIGAPARRMRQ